MLRNRVENMSHAVKRILIQIQDWGSFICNYITLFKDAFRKSQVRQNLDKKCSYLMPILFFVMSQETSSKMSDSKTKFGRPLIYCSEIVWHVTIMSSFLAVERSNVRAPRPSNSLSTITGKTSNFAFSATFSTWFEIERAHGITSWLLND